MEPLAKEFGPQGIDFVFVYVREAHPGETYPCHTSIEEKVSNAQDMVKRWSIERRMLVDGLDGSVHQAYGSLPNMTYILGVGGTVIYRASWTDERTIRMALEQIMYERGERRNRTRVTPYYVDWIPQRVNDRIKFVEALADDVGPRAVDEFIRAVEFTTDETTAKPMWDWWEQKQAAQSAVRAD
jgi:hypothetical protein